jgi:hypothetical protein
MPPDLVPLDIQKSGKKHVFSKTDLMFRVFHGCHVGGLGWGGGDERRNGMKNGMKNGKAKQDIGQDMAITKVKGRDGVPGTWINGTLNDHKFQALVFANHADHPDYELGASRISKLWIQRMGDQKVVFLGERGEVIPAQDDTAKAIVGFLCEGLAETVYPE